MLFTRTQELTSNRNKLKASAYLNDRCLVVFGSQAELSRHVGIPSDDFTTHSNDGKDIVTIIGSDEYILLDSNTWKSQ